ncbi:nucleoside hydrolase [Demequina sp. SYSU T00039]|uniref:Nucleoside hydrolase n=1 Tax=Demequina lignilytica TaxID=3051663 RepID=A0AAW7M4W0_9MICO|nr:MULTISPECIES: nucleoside hydrolase [unclassified Demequina]MDN4478766.1 nucleoside hydrolase [Demequina sp. SYSU T00039-1]MDN4489194.1 nucleoside hydrolase [Demequina sp. SYSU T00039]
MTRLPDPSAVHDVPADRRWALGAIPWIDADETAPRTRVIIDNDFMGDPDDLFQLVHHLLSPSVEIPLIVSSHLHVDEPWDPTTEQAAHGVLVVRDILARMGITGADDRVVAGAETAMPDPATPLDTPAARAIIAEALRDDPRPLYYCAGGGLTDLASALLLEPAIADRMTLVWIGGSEHPGIGLVAPEVPPAEYNLTIDVPAAQAVFGDTAIPIWQVPRPAYRQAIVTAAELRTRVRPHGSVGAHLHAEIREVGHMLAGFGMNAGETYVMGDQPLVLLTALQTAFEPDPASSDHVTLPAPRIDAEGLYEPRPDGRPIRVYTAVDNRLTFADLEAKLAELAAWQADR